MSEHSNRKMMKKILWMLIPCFLCLTVCGCSSFEKEDDGNNPLKDLRLTTKQISFIQEGNQFTGRLLSQVDAYVTHNQEEAWFVSPLSLQMVLAMMLNGAAGETADEICHVLGYGQDEIDAINELSHLLLDKLPTIDKKTDLVMANALFHNNTISLKAPYRQAVSQHYDATLEALDFTKTRESVATINKWGKKQTNGLIPEVIKEVNPMALTYILNALYFKSAWQTPFDKKQTERETFTREDGSTTKVPMMKLSKEFLFSDNSLYQAVHLPFGNGAFKMCILLPKKNHTVKDVLATLSEDGFSPYGSTASVDLWVPRFETKYHIEWKEVLQEMGMVRSFDRNAADFSLMSDRKSYVERILQDAVFKVNEEGAEAAAVTAGIMVLRASGGQPRKVVFHADRPFIYLITETSTGVILFAGKYSGH